MKTGKTQLVPDITKDPDYFSGVEIEGVTFRSELCVPVKQKDRVVAVINLESEKLNGFSENDAKIVELLAGTYQLDYRN